MHAVIETGGKQYRVAPGDIVEVELLGGEPEAGSKVKFDRVLLVTTDDGIKVGEALSGASVGGVLLGEMRGEKIRVFKYKKRKQYRRTKGHRQYLHQVKIENINV
ncbi:MAG: 50S ribosomal protein L21 [Thermoanaerobaculia bacterium]|jgi:large subunit ribosomal protein L21|nr:50S ribosomal protein L21 [Thermoanaerobaculia bacterium]